MNMFKTTTAKNAEEYIAKLESPRKEQIQKVHDLIKKTVPKLKPFIISGMIGYGPYRYKSKSGREGGWCVVALASQKHYISLYACGIAEDGKQYVAEKYKDQLGKTSVGKSCIRFKKIEDVNLEVLKKVLLESEKSPMGAV